MTPKEEPIQIIGNESNMVYEITPGSHANSANAGRPEGANEEKEDLAANNPAAKTPQPSNDLANNDGSIVESLDTAFHGKPGTTTGINSSGSDRADYYEKQADGQSDAEEEL